MTASVEPVGEESALVDDEPAGQAAAEEALMLDGVDVAEGVGVV